MAILTSCAPQKAESEEQVASVQSASSERTTSVSSQEEVEEPNSDAIFQKALDDVADADNCYLIVSDYNGDGAQEAFAFTGVMRLSEKSVCSGSDTFSGRPTTSPSILISSA